MADKKVSENLCKERSGNIEEKVDRLIASVEHLKGNCLTTIKNKLAVLETHHKYSKSNSKEIKKSLDDIKELIKPKENNKESNTRLAFKIIGILAIIIYLLLSGSVETSKEFLTGLFLG